LVVVLASAFWANVPLRADDPVGALTWKRDIEPLIRDRCLACHAANGPALPRLESYEDVVASAAAVKAVVMSRKMPIWAPLRGIGRFHGDPSLSPEQISRMASWIESRRSRGTDNAPVLRSSRRPFLPPATATVGLRLERSDRSREVERQTLLLPAKRLDVVAWRFEPGDPAIRQAIFKDSAGRIVWTWIAGDSGEVLPAGTGVRLSPPLVVEVQRRPLSGSAENPAHPTKESQLRLWIAATAIRPLEVLSIPCNSALARSGRVYGLRPTAPGASRVVVKERGTGRTAAVFAERQYSLLRTYWLREPLNLPAGTGLTVEGSDCSLDAVISPQGR
jgi:hypothetical protein